MSHTETGFTGKRPCLAFKSPLCGHLMNHYVIAPSNAKKPIIKDIAVKMNRYFRSISEWQLLDFSFLSADDPFEAALKLYCLENFPDFKSIILWPRADCRFFDMVAEGRMLDATNELSDVNPVTLLLSSDPDLDCTFAAHVWSYELRSCIEEACERKRCSSIFTACVTASEHLKPTVEEFCARIEPGDYPYDDARVRIFQNYNLIELLYKRDFDGLLRGLIGSHSDDTMM